MITHLIIRDPQRFVQVWLTDEKAIALRTSLNTSAPAPERIPAYLQKRVEAKAVAFERELNDLVGVPDWLYPNWLELAETPEPIEGHSDWNPPDFMANATCLRADWGTAARKKARREARENRRKYRVGQGVQS